MYGIVLAGHGQFSNGIKSMVELVMGPQEKIEYINYEGECSSSELKSKFELATKNMGDIEGIIFLTDLKGGTPFNAAVEFSVGKPNVHVFGGINIPMVVAALEVREGEEVEDNILEILTSGRDEIALFQMKNERVEEEFEEGI